MSTSDGKPVTLEQHVLPWLREHERDAAAVERVTGTGTDWQGDAEGGYTSSFVVSIVYRDSAGFQRFYGVMGEEMQSLWAHVVGGWPPGAPAGAPAGPESGR